MADKVLVVFTAETIATVLKAGGTQSWRLSPTTAKDCEYAVLCQNTRSTKRRKSWVIGGNPRDQVAHGTAFLIGHISDIVPSKQVQARRLVEFDKFARIELPDFWHGQQNPIHYISTEESPELSRLLSGGLAFESMPEEAEEAEMKEPPAIEGRVGPIAGAKATLAAALGIEPEAIEIIIHC